MKKTVRILGVLLAVICLISAFTYTATAKTPNNSFTYDLENNAISAPQAAEFCLNITGEELGIGSFSEPTDVFSDTQGRLYIVDKGNSRIVITDVHGRLLKILDSFNNNGTTDKLNLPEGITVTEAGDIYICDTGNFRLVHLNPDYSLKRIIKAPTAAVLGEEFEFTPVKIAVDKLNRIYVVSRNFNSGIIELNKEGVFNEIYGSIKVTYSVTDILWNMVSTKAQKERSIALVPNEYSSVCVDENNFVYACSAYYDSTSSSSGSVKKLNALGNNVLDGVPDESINRNVKGTYIGPETYVDICSMGNEIYGLLDNTRGRIFVYNNDGDMLFEFGGKGIYNTTFGTVAAISYSNGYFYIADSRNDFISVFALTDYAKLFLSAAEYHSIGDYEAENSVWEEIYKLNNNSICAIRNFGRVNYREGDYIEAMKYFKLANDRKAYSEAFEKQRKIVINDNFTLIFISSIVIVILIICFMVYKSKHKKEFENKQSYRATLSYSTKVIFRPISGFWDMKRERYGSTAAAVTILSVVTLMYALYSSLEGFIFTSGTKSASFVMGLITVLLPFFLFIMCNWCVSNLMDGEGSFKYIFMGTSYALTPMIFILPVLLVMSRVMTMAEDSVYTLVIGIMLLWVAYLIICSNMQIHSYSMSKTVLVLVITLLVMVIVIFLAMLIFALAQKVVGVAVDMYNELYLRF
ncbi:MAG: YIP1 family protein [Clostridia bacterium]|nr:YIP1 family protein [Clostridia bacterium]